MAIPFYIFAPLEGREDAVAATGDRRKVSVVVPCFNEAKVFPFLRGALTSLMDSLTSSYAVEAVLVDDGSRDETWLLMREFAGEDPRVRAVSLSRNFGHQAALSC